MMLPMTGAESDSAPSSDELELASPVGGVFLGLWDSKIRIVCFSIEGSVLCRYSQAVSPETPPPTMMIFMVRF